MALDSTNTDQSHKSHRSRQAGPKKKTKSDKNKKKQDVSENDKRQNPKVLFYSIPLSSLNCKFIKFEYICLNIYIHVCMYI